MPTRALRLTAASLSTFIGCLHAYGQAAPQASPTRAETTVDDKENKAILEVGAATSWNVSGGAATFAPNLAIEIEPIENWLELEVGVSPFYTYTSKEWDTDLLFKKPWTLSRKAEFMLGIGPQWVHVKQGGRWTNALAAEIAGDFMFWPTGKHHFGWFLEPAYDYSFATGVRPRKSSEAVSRDCREECMSFRARARKQSPPASGIASGMPSTLSQHWPRRQISRLANACAGCCFETLDAFDCGR